VIHRLTGYRVVRDGDDWLIPDDDPQLIAGPKPLLQTAVRPVSLSAESYKRTAADYVENYLSDFEQWRADRPQPTIHLTSSYGFLSKLQEIHYRFFFEDRRRLEQLLIERILPFMHRTLGAGRVAPVKISVEEQYGILALAKIAYITKEFGFEKATMLVGKHAMSSVLPAATEVLSYVQGLLTFTPMASTLPLDRMGSQLHFFSPRGPWGFPFEAIRGIFAISSAHTLPMCEIGRPPFIDLAEHANQQYFLLAVEAINRLLRFLNDPRNFVDQAGEFDLNHFLKTQSGIHLMFADLLAINHTTSVYLHARTALSFMDKLSNLKATLATPSQNEDEIFKSLFSAQAGRVVAKVLSHHGGQRHDKLGKALKHCAETIFGAIHEHLSKALPNGHSERDRLELIRTFRNTTHGSFLRARQFEKAFATSAATIPPQLPHVPLLYAWALALDPEQILTL
jgi:hypothetical protein